MNVTVGIISRLLLFNIQIAADWTSVIDCRDAYL